MLILHVTVAILSVILVSLSYAKATKRKIWLSYLLIAATLISGTVVTIQSHAKLIPACTSGLIYIGFMSLGINRAQHKLNLALSKDEHGDGVPPRYSL